MITWCIRFVWMSRKPKEKEVIVSHLEAQNVFLPRAGWFSAQQCTHSLEEATTLGCVAAGEPPFFVCAPHLKRRDSPLFGCMFAFHRVYGRLSRVTRYVVFLSTAVIKGDMILKREQRMRAALWWHAVFVAPKGNERFPHRHVLYEKPLWAIKPADMILTDTKAVGTVLCFLMGNELNLPTLSCSVVGAMDSPAEPSLFWRFLRLCRKGAHYF